MKMEIVFVWRFFFDVCVCVCGYHFRYATRFLNSVCDCTDTSAFHLFDLISEATKHTNRTERVKRIIGGLH